MPNVLRRGFLKKPWFFINRFFSETKVMLPNDNNLLWHINYLNTKWHGQYLIVMWKQTSPQYHMLPYKEPIDYSNTFGPTYFPIFQQDPMSKIGLCCLVRSLPMPSWSQSTLNFVYEPFYCDYYIDKDLHSIETTDSTLRYLELYQSYPSWSLTLWRPRKNLTQLTEGGNPLESFFGSRYVSST